MSKASLWKRVMEQANGDISVEFARYVLALDFSPTDQARYADLSAKAQQGELCAEERTELESILDVSDLLAIIQAHARAILSGRSPSA